MANRFSKSADTKNYEKLKIEHLNRYGSSGLLSNKPVTNPRDYEKKYYKITTKGPNKGKLVDTRNNNTLVTKEYRKKIRKEIEAFGGVQHSQFAGRNREIVFGSRTKWKDRKYRNQLRLIKEIEQKRDNPLRASIPKFFKGKTAEGGLLHNYHLNQEIEKQQALANQLRIGTTEDRAEKFNQAEVEAEAETAATKAKADIQVPTPITKTPPVTPTTTKTQPVAPDTGGSSEPIAPKTFEQIWGRKPTSIQKNLMKGGWTAQELYQKKLAHEQWKKNRRRK